MCGAVRVLSSGKAWLNREQLLSKSVYLVMDEGCAGSSCIEKTTRLLARKTTQRRPGTGLSTSSRGRQAGGNHRVESRIGWLTVQGFWETGDRASDVSQEFWYEFRGEQNFEEFI